MSTADGENEQQDKRYTRKTQLFREVWY